MQTYVGETTYSLDVYPFYEVSIDNPTMLALPRFSSNNDAFYGINDD
jgi:hypothetical protein